MNHPFYFEFNKEDLDTIEGHVKIRCNEMHGSGEIKIKFVNDLNEHGNVKVITGIWAVT